MATLTNLPPELICQIASYLVPQPHYALEHEEEAARLKAVGKSVAPWRYAPRVYTTEHTTRYNDAHWTGREGQAALYSLIRTCRYLYETCHEYLYHAPCVVGNTDAYIFLTTLGCRRKDLQRRVQHLVLWQVYNSMGMQLAVFGLRQKCLLSNLSSFEVGIGKGTEMMTSPLLFDPFEAYTCPNVSPADLDSTLSLFLGILEDTPTVRRLVVVNLIEHEEHKLVINHHPAPLSSRKQVQFPGIRELHVENCWFQEPSFFVCFSGMQTLVMNIVKCSHSAAHPSLPPHQFLKNIRTLVDCSDEPSVIFNWARQMRNLRHACIRLPVDGDGIQPMLLRRLHYRWPLLETLDLDADDRWPTCLDSGEITDWRHFFCLVGRAKDKGRLPQLQRVRGLSKLIERTTDRPQRFLGRFLGLLLAMRGCRDGLEKKNVACTD